MDSRRGNAGAVAFIGGLLAVLGPVLYLAFEAVSAHAWRAGDYDYGHNFISDLGTTVCGSEFDGRVMCSPLHALMNSGYVIIGVSLGVLFTALAIRSRRGRVPTAVFGWAIAAGMICVASVPGEAASVEGGTILFHVVGAAVAILSANALFVSVGIRGRRLSLPAWLGPVTVTFGVLGIVGFVLTVTPQEIAEPAVFERVSVYSIFVSSIATGIALLSSRRGAPDRLRPRAGERSREFIRP